MAITPSTKAKTMQFNYFKPKFNFVVKPSKKVHFDIISCVWEKMLSKCTYKAY